MRPLLRSMNSHGAKRIEGQRKLALEIKEARRKGDKQALDETHRHRRALAHMPPPSLT